jgi:WD40 repeat protein
VPGGTLKIRVSAAIGPEGDWALAGSTGHRIYLWDLRTGEVIGRLEGHQNPVAAIALSSDGRIALSRDAYGPQLILWDVEKGEPLSYLNAHEYKLWTMNHIAVDISRDGLRGLSSSVEGTMVLWDLADLRKLQRLTGHADTVGDLAMGRLGSPSCIKGAASPADSTACPRHRRLSPGCSELQWARWLSRWSNSCLDFTTFVATLQDAVVCPGYVLARRQGMNDLHYERKARLEQACLLCASIVIAEREKDFPELKVLRAWEKPAWTAHGDSSQE